MIDHSIRTHLDKFHPFQTRIRMIGAPRPPLSTTSTPFPISNTIFFVLTFSTYCAEGIYAVPGD